MLFRPPILLILVFTTVSLCKPAKQDENGGEDDDYDHEEGDQDMPVVEDKAPPPDDGSPDCHKIYETRLQPHDADVDEQPTEHDKKISGQAKNTYERQDRLSQSKRRISDELLKDKEKQNVGDKLAEIEEEVDFNYDGAERDWKLDYADDREANNKFNIQPLQGNKNRANKKNKHWFDFYRNRRDVQNSKIQRGNSNNEKEPEDEETAIKRHIKKLTTDELELLLKSLSDEKRILLQSIIDSDENVNKREITKKAGAAEENSMIIEAGSQQFKSAMHETESATNNNLVTMTAKSLATRSVDLSENEDKVNNVAEIMDSEYDFNESAMVQSAKAESKRDARDDYDHQGDDPDDDDENVKSNNDRRIRNRRLHKRTADGRDDSLADSMKALEESFSNNLNLDSEMAPLIRVKRTHDNGRNYTQSNRSRLEEEEDNKLYNIGSDEADNFTLPSEMQASLVSAEGENVLDSIEVAEPEITYPINDESQEIKNWNLLNCSCENVSFEIPRNLPDDTESSDPQSRRSTKEFELRYPAIDSEVKNVGRMMTNLKLIENNSSEKNSMYQDSDVFDSVTKTKGLQRYKRIRRVKQTQNI